MMNDLKDLSQELCNQLVDRLVALTKNGKLTWFPYAFLSGWGYITTYKGFHFYITEYNSWQHRFYVFEGDLPAITAGNSVYAENDKDLYYAASEHCIGEINAELLVSAMGLKEAQDHILLPQEERDFLADQYSPGTFKYFDSEDAIHMSLFKAGFLEVNSAGMPGLIGLTSKGKSVGKRCFEDKQCQNTE